MSLSLTELVIKIGVKTDLVNPSSFCKCPYMSRGFLLRKHQKMKFSYSSQTIISLLIFTLIRIINQCDSSGADIGLHNPAIRKVHSRFL